MRTKVLIFKNDFHFVYAICMFLNIMGFFSLLQKYEHCFLITKIPHALVSINGVLIDRKNVYLSQII